MIELPKYKILVADPKRSVEDLIRMRERAIEKGMEEHVAVVTAELDKRDPKWNAPKARRSARGTPASARIYQEREAFNTTKDAFVWLIGRFVRLPSCPSIEKIQSLGKARRFVAVRPDELYVASPDLAENPSNYSSLPNGWYVDVNLSNAQKFGFLARISLLLDLRHPKDWDLDVSDGNEKVSFEKALHRVRQGVWDDLNDEDAASLQPD